MDSARSAYLFLSLLQARTGSSLISRLGDLPPEEVPRMSAEQLSRAVKMTDRAMGIFDKLRREFDPDRVEKELSEAGVGLLTPVDAGYPERLIGMVDLPPALFVRGSLPGGPAVALVGSRKASVTGLGSARRLGRALAERGACVVSGLALGIDAAAHEGALAGGGTTVGVLGCGIDVVYPRSNRGLFSRVEGSGSIISEYYLGEAPLAWRFPARNRVIAGLSETLVVVEAPEKSGALITARHALEAGRDVWAVPGPLGVAECRGSNRLLADGAGVVWDLDAFLDEVLPEAAGPYPGPQGGGANAALPEGLPENEARVLAALGFEATPVDVVAGNSGLEVRELLSAVSMLELKGYVGRDAAGTLVRKPVD